MVPANTAKSLPWSLPGAGLRPDNRLGVALPRLGEARPDGTPPLSDALLAGPDAVMS